MKIGDWAIAQKKTLYRMFDTGWDGEETTYDKICHVEDSADAYETDAQIQSPDEIAESVEGGMYSRLEIEQVRTKTYTHLLFKAEIKITKEMVEDSKYSLIYDGVKHLGRAAKRTIERKVTACLINGFSSELSPDGQPVFASHTLAMPQPGRPTTYSNLFTGRLNATNLKTMRTSGRKTLDENGSIAPKKYKRLIVPSALEFTAKQIKGSTGEAGTANNDMNPHSDIEVVVNDWLSEASSNGDTMHFLQDPTDHKFMLFFRVRPQQDRTVEEASGDLLYRTRFRLSCGFSDYRGMAGSTGVV